jgi:CubicO group peptidase (beta-lactamase class C family)
MRLVHFCLAAALVTPAAVHALPASAREADPSRARMNSDWLDRADSLILEAIERRITPGAALAVGRAGHMVRLRGYGAAGWEPGAALVTDSTLFDIASLTKVVVTTSAIMRHVDSGEVVLDAPIHRYLAWWPRTGAKGAITVRHLLQHTSGLPAGSPLHRVPGDRSRRVRHIATLPLVHAPGTRALYGDLNMVLLGDIVEQIRRERLDRYAERRLFATLALRETAFFPQGSSSPFELRRFVPTEQDRWLRHRLLVAEPQDPIAFALGGVAGNAGVFSSVRDLALFADDILSGTMGRPSRIAKPATIAEFVRGGTHGRALGWDRPSGTNSAAGDILSARSFGHTGYTGTSIWIDPERDLFVVLLTSRLRDPAHKNGHLALRRAVHDAVARSITDVPATPRSGSVGP